MKNIWLNGIMGVVVGDALGVPVEFESRFELAWNPVKEMRGYGTYNLPAGSWSDDSSMTLATLDSLKNGYNLKDIMDKFCLWIMTGEYTPFGEVFDVGNTCSRALLRYSAMDDVRTCGECSERDNGNGSLMRIMPMCLYVYERQKLSEMVTAGESVRAEMPWTNEIAIEKIHEVSALTHGHLRSKIACGLYYFMVKSILDNSGSLRERLQAGLDEGFAFYGEDSSNLKELDFYKRVKELEVFANVSVDEIRSSGYVVDTFEAALWCLLGTDTYADCTLKAVNLGGDTDTVAAIAGGLAGLYYGYEGIPKEWLEVVQKREWIEGLCMDML